MLFVGEHKHSLDAKNRLFIPAKYRDMLGDSFYITRKMEKCLAIYSESEWNKLTDKLNTLPDSVVGSIKQFLYSKTISVSPDSQGRVVLPPELLAYAGIEKNTVIIGVGDHLQIWSDGLWEEKENAIDTAVLMEQLRQLGL
ncbi:MAG: division/cell wall cluster transcriptional repressor MraZ [Clostridia bacterium]|nr:division/cell wall cluster transcriptional repressor MraZ [Clostridia bacterium]